MIDFAVGSLVQLKSGGAEMTIIGLSEGEVCCAWTSSDGRLQKHELPLEALMQANPIRGVTIIEEFTCLSSSECIHRGIAGHA